MSRREKKEPIDTPAMSRTNIPESREDATPADFPQKQLQTGTQNSLYDTVGRRSSLPVFSARTLQAGN